MAKVNSWYCESVKNNLHAFCLLRSPYKKSVQNKIKQLADGHGFLSWTIMKIDEATVAEFAKNNIEYDSLYVGEKKPETVN